MSEQMFSPQENEPRRAEERQANTDPSEQYQGYETPPQWDSSAYSSYEQGYRGYDIHAEGEKMRPPSSMSSKQWIWIIIAIFVVLVIGGSLLNTILGSVFFVAAILVLGYVIWRLAFNQAVQLPLQSFTVSGQQDLIVDNQFGAIRIHRGSANAVEVRGTRYYSSLFPSRPSYPLNAIQQGNQIRVEAWNPQARRTFTFGDFGRIDLHISIPESSDVHVRSDASAITVDGIQGQAFIRTNAGSINVQNVKLEGNARMETNAGTISFSGSVNPNGQYSFETNAGTIDMALPAGTAFMLHG